jgi:C1A family cysteine protease
MNALTKFATSMVGLAAVNDTEVSPIVEREFIQHISTYGKSYGTKEEYLFRLSLFAEKHAAIAEHNSMNGSFTLGHNKFSDWTDAEYKRLLGFKKGNKRMVKATQPTILDVSDIPDEIDWRKKGAVNAVKDQGQCGSCWAFSATCAIEGAHFKQTGTLLSLSEQQLVDCDAQSDGCNGGLQEYAMDYLEKNQQETESDYPYKAADGKCQTDASEGKVLVAQIHDVKPESVDQLKAAIAQGPVSVTIEADKTVFQMYSGGIFDSTLCGTDLDHAVTAVGYGSDVDRDYYIVRNSWGASWGEQGYIRILATKGKGICGIQQVSLWPSTN